MQFKKTTSVTAAPVAEAIKKLSTEDTAKTAQPEKFASHNLGMRDFAAEARGKTRCALEEAWAQSPLLPMLVKDPNDRAELHRILDEVVTERMKRVFPNG